MIEDTGLRRLQSTTPLPARVAKDDLVAAFKRVKAYIEANSLSIDELEVYLTQVELGMTGGQNKRRKTNFRPGQVESRDAYGGGDGGDGGDNQN
jgi:hypothetical protein